MKTRLFALMILLMMTTSAFADRDRDHYSPFNHASNHPHQTNYFYKNQSNNYVYKNKYHKHYYDNAHAYYGRPAHPRYYNDAVGVILGVAILGYMLGDND